MSKMDEITGGFIKNGWSNSNIGGEEEIDLLVYQSRLLGAEQSLVLWGGGNTSLKVEETDFRGRAAHVLRVKGSGSDLKSVVRSHFPGVRMDDVLPLMERDSMTDEEMVAYLAHTLMEPGSSRPSIETLLHAFVPARSVVHSHADAILALTNNESALDLLREVYGDEVAVIPYSRPGFALSKEVGFAVRANPQIKGVVLLNHGLITWHDDPQQAYALHIEMVNRAVERIQRGSPKAPVAPVNERPGEALGIESVAAAVAPVLRGVLSQQGRLVVRFDGSSDALRLVSGEIVPLDRMESVLEEGAATPDHILNTKRKPLWLDLPRGTLDNADPALLRQAVEEGYNRWAGEYRAYYDSYSRGEPMLPVQPRIVLVRGVGIFSVGMNSRAATIAADIYRHTIGIIEAAERVGRYRSLSAEEAFAAEYWPLELYKLTTAPPEKELSRRVVMLTGAAGAIGAGIAGRFAAEGAHVVCGDLYIERATALATELSKANPTNRAMAVQMDVTREDSVQEAYRRAILEYGGIDILVSNAGIAKACPIDELSLADWEQSLAVNSTGHFLVAREALRVMKAQGTGGNMVFVATKNVTAPGKDFGAYSASKAAEAQLARVLALEGGPYGIRSNMVNPDAVFAGSGLWSPEVREQRARAQGIDPGEIEEFYRKRNLLQVEVTTEDVAEAALFLASGRSAKTTGAMLPVDGGLREAFPR